MRRSLLVVPLLLAAGCATRSPYAPDPDAPYRAWGQRPYWEVLIQDGAILVRPVAGGGERRWPYVRARIRGEVRTWRQGSGAEGITITARHGTCRLDGQPDGVELQYEHFVTVRLGEDGPELNGCGGRIFNVSSSGPPRR